MSTPGDIIRTHREKRGYGQEDLGHALGRSFGAVSQWENNRVKPRRPTALRLDELLDAGGEILAALGYSSPSDGISNSDLRDEIRAVRAEMRTGHRKVLNEFDALRDTATSALAAIESISASVLAIQNRLGRDPSPTRRAPAARPEGGTRPPKSQRTSRRPA